MNKLNEIIEKRFKLISSIVFILLIIYAWFNRFVQDDAFISFRYAKNFVKGWGLVFNKGERVEGYTNFLWTLIISIPIRLGIAPVLFSYILGILLFALSLYFTFRISNFIFKSKTLSLLTVFLLGTNYTFSCYATGGMETQLQTVFVLISFFLIIKFSENKVFGSTKLFLLSIVSALSILTRPDSVLFVVIIFAAFYFFHKEKTLPFSKRLKNNLIFIIPFLLIIAIYLIWKLDYYGNILPNTYYVKAAGETSIIHGLIYIGRFITSYWLFPFLIILLFYFDDLYKNSNYIIQLLFITVIIWMLYIIKIGGGFMEFRFFVPVLPFLLIIVIWIVEKLFHTEKLKFVFILIIFAGSFFHMLTFHYVSGIESITNLKSHLDDPGQNWIGVGKKLNQLFANEDVKIAVTAAGAVPYYSGLPTLDMYGLNDPKISREQNIISNRPGHQKLAPVEYLRNQGVNLLIGEPFVAELPFRVNEISPKMLEIYFKYNIKDLGKLNPKILVTQIDEEHLLIMIYLKDNVKVDRAINQMEIKEFPFSEITFNAQRLTSE